MDIRLAAIAALLAAVPVASQPCDLLMKGAHVWTGGDYAVRDLAIRNGRFAADAGGLPTMDASALWLIPPFADAHTHTIDTPRRPADPEHAVALAQGVFYALNPNSIRPKGPTAAATRGEVELQAAGGGLTRPGGHPEPLYTFLATRGLLGPVKVADLPGRAFYPVSTPAETRNAVAAVKANGASVIKLYLLNHDRPESSGLSGALFDLAATEARALGLRPIVHIESAADFRRAVAAHVFAIVHAPYATPSPTLPVENYRLTAAHARAAAAAGIIVVPTAMAAFVSSDGAQLAKIRAYQHDNLVVLRDGGVKLAMGADTYGVTMQEELTTLRSFAVFEAPALIAMATVNGAALAFPGRRIGDFTPGGEASFIGWFQPMPGNWGSARTPVVGMRSGEALIDTAGMLAPICQVAKP